MGRDAIVEALEQGGLTREQLLELAFEAFDRELTALVGEGIVELITGYHSHLDRFVLAGAGPSG